MPQSCLGAGKGMQMHSVNQDSFSAGIAFQYLLGVPFCVRQLCRHMEHDLFVTEVTVDRFGTSLPVSHI